jgi:hypothetical protein
MVAMRRPRILVLVPMLAALLVGASALPAGAASWSTSPRVKVRNVFPSELVAVRAGRHAGFDRVVFELQGNLPGYRIQYVPQVVQDGSGDPVALAGNAFLNVVLTPTNAHDTETGTPTWTGPKRITTGFPAVEQIAFAGDFEGNVTFGLGIRHRAGFRVLELRDPTRIVVDVAHPAKAGGTTTGTATGTGTAGDTGAGTAGDTGTGTATGATDAGQLPFTGLEVLALLGAGVGLLGVGLALLAAERRRRQLAV